jgi:mono/diheme cytochrome c family protein/peroxiredoxin
MRFDKGAGVLTACVKASYLATSSRATHGSASQSVLGSSAILRCLIGIFLTGLICCVLSPPAAAQALAFTSKTADGQIFELATEQSSSTVVCFLGTQCPMARGYAGQLNQLHRDFAQAGVRIVGVMSNRQDSADDIVRYAQDLKIEFPLVHDVGNLIADRFGASRTPEVYLLDRQLKLRYHGRIDDQLAPGVARATATRHDLRVALEQVLAGKPVSIPATAALGCIIGRVASAQGAPAGENGVTYTNQVARVLQRHCVECHRAGEIGPFAMDSFEEVVGWAETMLETVEQGRMPPWHADPNFGDFVNERAMPETDKQILRDWIAGGSKRGLDSDLPAPRQWVEGWNLPRPPDLIVSMRARPFSVPKEGVIEYQYFVADPGLTEDTWVTAAEVIPGARSVVHHAIVFVRPPDGADFRGVGWLSAYVPGQRVHELPPGRARKVAAGSKFVFQMHYTPNGVEQMDVTSVGLLFTQPEHVTHEVLTLMAIDQEFEIPPGASDFAVQARTQWIPAEAELLAITPHMHVRGKSFKLFTNGPHASPLLSVPAYDFNWQHTYQLREPIALNSSTHGLEFEATFDNSSANPFNPDPTETVTWGDQTWEEMAVAFFEVARPIGTKELARPRQAMVSVDASPSGQPRQEKVDSYVERVFRELDANRDGLVQKNEVDIVVRHMHFGLWDLNRDNVVSREEVQRVAEKLF